MQKTNVSSTITLLHWVSDGAPKGIANGLQKDNRRYTNNTVYTDNKDNTHTGCEIFDNETIELIWSKWIDNSNIPLPPNQEKIIANALIDNPVEYWMPFLEKRQEIKHKKGFVHDNLKYWFSGGYREMNDRVQNIKKEFKKTKTGLYKAYCSKCFKLHLANDYQLRQPSECHRVELIPEIPK